MCHDCDEDRPGMRRPESECGQLCHCTIDQRRRRRRGAGCDPRRSHHIRPGISARPDPGYGTDHHRRRRRRSNSSCARADLAVESAAGGIAIPSEGLGYACNEAYDGGGWRITRQDTTGHANANQFQEEEVESSIIVLASQKRRGCCHW